MSGKQSGLEALSKLSGIPQTDIKKIWHEVQENARKLEGCNGPHDFHPRAAAPSRRPDFICTKCLGVVDAINHGWYVRGLQHGMKSHESSKT